MTKNSKRTIEPLKIMLVGEGGQGIQTIAKILARTCDKAGYHASVIPNFGTEQRGGISIAFLQISKVPIIAPKFQTADLFVIVSDRNIERTTRYIGPHTSVLYDKDLVSEPTVKKLNASSTELTSISAFEFVTTELTERSFNIFIVGILTGIIDPDLKEKVLPFLDRKFKDYYKKSRKLREQNRKAFYEGYKLTQEQS